MDTSTSPALPISTGKTKKPINPVAPTTNKVTTVDVQVTPTVRGDDNGSEEENDLNDEDFNFLGIDEDEEPLYDLVFEQDGILIPPKKLDAKEIAVDEIELIAKLSNDVMAEQLWVLVCCTAQQSLDNEHPGATFSTKDLLAMYCNYAEQVFLNYPDTSHGMEVLRYFAYNKSSGKSEWPTYLKQKWNEIRQECRKDLQKWLKQKNCPLSNIEQKEMDDSLKLRVYIGHVIDLEISKAEKIANNHLNKHWPSHFKSGESTTGMLQTIRRWYYETIENQRKAENAYKVWAGKNKTSAEKHTQRQKDEDLQSRMKKNRLVVDGFHRSG